RRARRRMGEDVVEERVEAHVDLLVRDAHGLATGGHVEGPLPALFGGENRPEPQAVADNLAQVTRRPLSVLAVASSAVARLLDGAGDDLFEPVYVAGDPHPLAGLGEAFGVEAKRRERRPHLMRQVRRRL